MGFPVTLPDARRQLRLEADDETRDLDLLAWIADAAAWVENYTGFILAARDITEQFRGFAAVELSAWPIKPIAIAAVGYNDADGVPVAAVGTLDATRRPARVGPPVGIFWPFRSTDQLFTVTIRAGYEDTDIVPGNFKRAMLMLISAYDQDREGGDLFQKAEQSARMLCGPFRLIRI